MAAGPVFAIQPSKVTRSAPAGAATKLRDHGAVGVLEGYDQVRIRGSFGREANALAHV